MIKRIIVENYKSFKNKTIFNLEKFNVFIGPNNSGKSNFKNLVFLISSLARDELGNIFGPSPFSFKDSASRIKGVYERKGISLRVTFETPNYIPYKKKFVEYYILFKADFNSRTKRVKYIIEKEHIKGGNDIEKCEEVLFDMKNTDLIVEGLKMNSNTRSSILFYLFSYIGQNLINLYINKQSLPAFAISH